MALATLPTIDATAFFGTRRYDSFATDEVEPKFLDKLIILEPNGANTLTSITDMTPSMPINNADITWFEENMPAIQDSTTLYTSATLGTPDGTVTAGTLTFAKVDAAFAGKFRERAQVRMAQILDPAKDFTGWVEQVVINGASSYLKIRALTTSTNGANVDSVSLIANVNPDGSYRPESVSYNRGSRTNKSQTFRWPIRIDRRTYRQKYRTVEQALESERRRTLTAAGREVEGVILFGELSESTVDGKRMTTMEGIIPSIRNHALGNEFDFYQSTETAYAGFAWDQAGEQFLDDYSEQLFHYGASRDRMCLCGSGFLGALTTVAKVGGNLNLAVGANKYGLDITTWITPHGKIHLHEHVLFTEDPAYRFSGLFLEAENLQKYQIDAFAHKVLVTPESTDEAGFDGTVEEYTADFCIATEKVDTMMLWNGVGLDNKTYTAP